MVAAVSSLAIVVVAMVQSSSQQDGAAVATVILSVLSVTLSWALVNTVFAFKYARMYYVDPPRERGFAIDAEGPPAYVDFACMAFTVGMSFAVSDTEPAATSTRRVVLLHALLSYGFGTGVLAVSINLVTNLGQ